MLNFIRNRPYKQLMQSMENMHDSLDVEKCVVKSVILCKKCKTKQRKNDLKVIKAKQYDDLNAFFSRDEFGR